MRHNLKYRANKNITGLALAIVIAVTGVCGCGQFLEAEHVETSAPEAVTCETESGAEIIIYTEPAVTFFSASDIVYITADNVNVREDFNEDGKVISVMDKGSQLQRTGYNDAWSRVLYEGRECYIVSKYVTTTRVEAKKSEVIEWEPLWKYADASAIHSGAATLYYAQGSSKGKTVCVNAGHGTIGGSDVKTYCHPDESPKVTSGSTEKGAIKATAVAYGTTMSDGTPEHKVTLKLALELKEKLLEAGYHVLMIRETEDVQLDNIARTVIANQYADCHIALHYDSSQNDKGAFYMSVPNVASYRSMEPVASYWQEHNRLGESLIDGLDDEQIRIFSSGSMEMDLTQTSYSTIPSVDLEVGDKASDYTEPKLKALADGIVIGVDRFFEQ